MSDRAARKLLERAGRMDIPAVGGKDHVPMSRMDFARACGIVPDPWQERVLESEARKLIMLCARQTGKSTVSKLLGVHQATQYPSQLVLMAAPSLRQSGELFRGCLKLLKEAEVPLPKIAAESALRVELNNGSRIIALPGSEATIRGYSAANLVVVDEASRVGDDLIAAIRPTLATTSGRLIALSTPMGRRGWFYLEWSSGHNWERSEVKASDCARISPEFLEDERRSLGPHVYAQEYENAFHDDDSAVFDSELIERAISPDVLPLWPLEAA